MTQVEPLSPNIFNVVVGVVLQHWVTVAAETDDAVNPGAARMERFWQNSQRLAEYFYAGNGLLASTLTTRL